jgi:hypothetical protein
MNQEEEGNELKYLHCKVNSSSNWQPRALEEFPSQSATLVKRPPRNTKDFNVFFKVLEN